MWLKHDRSIKSPKDTRLAHLPLLMMLWWLPAPLLAATITVGTLDDVVDGSDGLCSLREAIDNAVGDNQIRPDCVAGNGADLITFEAALFSGSPSEAVISLNSQLAIGTGGSPIAALTIAPPAGHRIVLEGSGSDRIISLGARAAPFLIEDAELRGGRSATGAAVALGSPNVTFRRVHFIDNIASFTGSGGGAINRDAASMGGLLQIEDCRFEDNVASASSGGAIYLVDGGVLDVVISGSDFVNNSANFDGGALFFRILALSDPGASSLIVTDSRFQGGTADAGAALSVQAATADSRVEVAIADSLFRDNRADSRGGAVATGGHGQGSLQSLQVQRSTFLDNGVDGAGGGAALQVVDMDFGLANSLLSGNDVAGNRGALSVRNAGSVLPRDVQLVGNSFHANILTGSFGERSLVLEAPADASSWQWRIAGNLFQPHPDSLPGNAIECALLGGSQGALTLSGGANISPDGDCLFLGAADLEADPAVVLENTGDPLKPRRLLPQAGSPAADLWPSSDCTGLDGAPLVVDLRGELRPRDGDGLGDAECDAGAFELPDADLVNITLDGTGVGTVVSSPPGIDCGAVCSAGFPEGDQITLIANAAAGSVFSGWSGDCSGSGDCQLDIAGDRNVTATFDLLPSHTLDVMLGGDGGGQVNSSPSGISCQPSCSASFAEGAEVTLAAVPDAQSVFTGWSGSACSGTGDCVLVLNADTTVSAEFTATHFPVTVGLLGNGIGGVLSDPAGIDCPDDCQAQFARNETISLTATAAPGSVFLGWEGDCEGFGTASCELDMDAGPYQADARFGRERTLSVALAGGGSGVVTSNPAGIDCPADCSVAYLQGSHVELFAAADAGSVFVGWSGECSGSQSCSLTLDTDRAVTATFQTGSHALVVSIDGEGSVSSHPGGIQCPGDCSETYLAGTIVELTAQAGAGHMLAHWGGDCSGSDTVCTVTIDQARSVTVEFVEVVDELFSDRFQLP